MKPYMGQSVLAKGIVKLARSVLLAARDRYNSMRELFDYAYGTGDESKIKLARTYFQEATEDYKEAAALHAKTVLHWMESMDYES